jgi:hypothetical protein
MNVPTEDLVSMFRQDAVRLMNKSMQGNRDAWSFGVAHGEYIQQLCDLLTPLLEQVENGGAISEQEWLIAELQSLKPGDRIVSNLAPKAMERLAFLQSKRAPKQEKQ